MAPISGRPALILHGGAGARRGVNYDAEIAHMRQVVETMKSRLLDGLPAAEAVVQAVTMLEDSGLYVAGRGASPNAAGAYELDASLMIGPDRRAGAVAALQGFRSPIRVAQAVMEKTPITDTDFRSVRFSGSDGMPAGKPTTR